MVIEVFCVDAQPVEYADIRDFIDEGIYFDRAPEYKLRSTPNRMNQNDWCELQIVFARGKRPIVISCERDPAELRGYVKEAIEHIGLPLTGSNEQLIAERLQSTKQYFSFEIDAFGSDEACWDLISDLEAWIAKERDGIIFASDEGFYNADLSIILAPP